MPTTAQPPTESLEAALVRISDIVHEMEEGRLPLETLIARYEEGVSLVKVCQGQLDAAEKRISLIVRDAKGGAQVRPFEDASPDEASSDV